MSGSIEASAKLGVMATLRRGLHLSPELTQGIKITLALAVISTAGRTVLPIAIQQITDTGIMADGGPDLERVFWLIGAAAALVIVTGACAYWASLRLIRSSENGLATLRVRAFRHIHDMSTLTQNTERRGSLVSRITSDVDTISRFVQWSGLYMVISAAQILVATVVMAVYSWQLTVLVWLCFIPVGIIMPRLQKSVTKAFLAVRSRMGAMLGGVAESVLGAETIRINAAGLRTQRRVDTAIKDLRDATVKAQNLASFGFSTGVLASGIAVAALVVAGTFLGMAGGISVGGVLAMLFLSQLFTGPVVTITEMLAEMQSALAGWRRVIAVLDTPVDVADPGADGVSLPKGPISIRFEDVDFAYPGGDMVLADVNLELEPGLRVAIVGETGSGKSTLAKLMARLMDPTTGTVYLDGVDLRSVRFESLRERVVMVPQEGFLFDDTLESNIRYAVPSATTADVERAVVGLGLDDWVAGLPDGLATQVGQRGESFSAGERQLVAIARAYLSDPDLLILDEATSAVDPATEVRIQRALDALTVGRSSVAIAHRLSTAEAADLVVVVDAGRIVEFGPHSELIHAHGRYSRMHASWIAQTR